MSRYDGLIIPRSYSEYINKTDAATLAQALQLSGVLSGAVAAGDNKAVKSSAVNSILKYFTQNQSRADFNDCNNAPLGFACSKNLANAPLDTVNFVYLLTLSIDDSNDYLEQLAFIINSVQTYRRIKSAGTWGPWTRLATSSELINKSYGGDIVHANQYAKLTITVTKIYSTTIIALMGRGASMALIGICANDSNNANLRTYLKDTGSYGTSNFYYKPISLNKIEIYWNTTSYSLLSNYQVIANAAYTELTTDKVDSLPEGVILL